MGVMEGDSAAVAIFGTQIERLKKEGKQPDETMLAEMEKVRQTYEKELDAKTRGGTRSIGCNCDTRKFARRIDACFANDLEHKSAAHRRVRFAAECLMLELVND